MQIGQKIIRLDTVDSTNNYTANLMKEAKIVHGTVIMADEQTSGRGQRGAIWSSDAGENILLSVYLTPDNLSVEEQVVLTYVTSISIVNLLEKIGISARIKWPNDIYVGCKKIAGILIENTISSGKIANTIIGIGLNINQLEFKDLKATSVILEKGEYSSVEGILFMLIFELNRQWDKLQNRKFDHLHAHYHDLLYLLHQSAYFEDSNGIFKGEIVGVSKKGLLVVDRSGNKMEYDLKEIKFIDQNAL